MPLQYTIAFEPSYRQWVVIDTENYDTELGYYNKKDGAKNAARLFNESSALLVLRIKVRVISNLIDDDANNLMEASDSADHPIASSSLRGAVAFNVNHIRLMSRQLKDAIKTDGGEPNNYALCVHCGASHHMDDDHTCTDPDDPDLLMDPDEYAAKHDKGGE